MFLLLNQVNMLRSSPSTVENKYFPMDRRLDQNINVLRTCKYWSLPRRSGINIFPWIRVGIKTSRLASWQYLCILLFPQKMNCAWLSLTKIKYSGHKEDYL